MTTQVEPSLTTSYLDLVGSKLRHKLGSQMNEHVNNGGSSIPAFAKAQLEKLGWKEGEGLGKRRQGMSSHIKVVKRAEGLGLGESTLDPALHQSLAAQDWWKHSVGNTLAKLSSKTKKPKKDKKKKKKKTKKDDDDDDDDDQSAAQETTTKTMKVYTDEELFQATGGARFGMRAQTRQQAKWKRAESNISAEEEEEAKRKVEWDGMAPPQVILKDTTTTTESTTTLVEENTKTKKKSTTDSALTTEEKEERKRDKKDKKKKRRRKDDDSTEKKGDDEEDQDNVGKKSKKAKKQKV